MNRIKPNVDGNLSLVYEPDPDPTRLFLTTSARKIGTDTFTLRHVRKSCFFWICQLENSQIQSQYKNTWISLTNKRTSFWDKNKDFITDFIYLYFHLIVNVNDMFI